MSDYENMSENVGHSVEVKHALKYHQQNFDV